MARESEKVLEVTEEKVVDFEVDVYNAVGNTQSVELIECPEDVLDKGVIYEDINTAIAPRELEEEEDHSVNDHLEIPSELPGLPNLHKPIRQVTEAISKLGPNVSLFNSMTSSRSAIERLYNINYDEFSNEQGPNQEYQRNEFDALVYNNEDNKLNDFKGFKVPSARHRERVVNDTTQPDSQPSMQEMHIQNMTGAIRLQHNDSGSDFDVERMGLAKSK
jgi:hypothetical protein